ncbi:YesL family protein [Evansella cellulosilytica]|uniref:DUF624 domain-containing protein n=1 Tax=Evansella cellulosilytica (strain ATCC 21833 / DSM 2522 / FERM P-1141 / JCM 9156 / N-4) TaxID=649639 RepID=E6TXF7_EVAC2|nr:DUF624 domain-containing protein [Evansella cellulosilytica]ADU28771.1 protein of unknown function DUF624 [Evansella cellulosilytica DSM 2522]
MDKRGFVGGVYALFEWIMRFSVINLLWLLFNLPILFFIVNLIFAQTIADFILLLIPIIILIPILFFPATTAMFASARSWIVDSEDLPLIRTYWRFYKSNYKKSCLGGIMLTILWVICVVDVYYFAQYNMPLMYVFIAMGLILFVYTINFFSLLSHYEMKLFALLKNTLLVTVASPLLFLTVVLSSALILYMSFEVFPFLIPFFTGAIIAFLSFSAFYRFYLKIEALKEA